MKIGVMFGDVTTSLFRRPITEKYPFERHETPPRLRGELRWNKESCTGCSMCVKDCPANALEMVVIDKKEKRFVLIYHPDRCTFCAQCVFTCMHDCLELSSDSWELASLERQTYKQYHGEPTDVVLVLEGYTPEED